MIIDMNNRREFLSGRRRRETLSLRSLSLALLAGLFLALSAGAATVQIDYDDSTDWSSYKTFAWRDVGPDHPVAPNPLTDQQIRDAITAELESKGFEPAEEDADFELVYHASAHDEFRVTDWGRGGRRWARRIEVDTYREGTLVLDVIERGSGELVWRGAISQLVPGPKQAEKTFAKGAKKLLKSFPPGD